MFRLKFIRGMLILLLLLLTAACNLTSAPEEAINNTAVPTGSATITTTPGGIPTSLSLTTQPPLTQLPPPTSIVQLPPTIPFASATPGFISIFIVSPIPGNTIAGNVQVLGSAVHPDFLQYQLEFGPDPNPGNLWYLIGGVNLTQVTNNLLGIWSTSDGRSPDGLYQLRLRVFLRNGTVSQTVVNNIKVQNQAPTLVPSATQSIPRPIAAFFPSPTTGKAPLVVNFTNLSSGNISGYSWTFGDGSTSNQTNPVHTYAAAGTYIVKLTVSGPGGQSNVSATIDVQTADPPKANFTATPLEGTAPLGVNFTNQSTGPITSYLWDFGDGTTSNEQNPAHRFEQRGTYNVILEARGPGGTDRKRATIVVRDPQVSPPVADFIPKTTTGNAPLTLQFQDRSTGQVNTYEWDFGDGTTSGEKSPKHVYQNPGTFNVKLTVNGNGGRSEATGIVTVNQVAQAPDAQFTAQPLSGNAPLQVNFTDTSIGTVTRYEWSFGDGSPVNTNKNPNHTYQNPGTYTVRLTVFGNNNTFDFIEQQISAIQPPNPPEVSFTANKTQGSAPLEVTFTNTSSGDNLQFAWDFGDGSTSNSQETEVTHTYQTNGVFTAKLTASNRGGQSDSATQDITVTDALNASFTSAQLNDPALGVQFTSTSSGSIATYTWDFGDGTAPQTGNGVITHTYAAAGNYPVTLTIADNSGGTDAATQQITVVAPTPTSEPPTATSEPPTATNTVEQPTATATSTPLPELPVASFDVVSVTDKTVTVNNTSTGEGITNWIWDFGDGVGTSFEQNPQPYTYAQAGTYRITLTAANATGPVSVSKEVTVTEPITAPTASFTSNTADGITFQFTDTSQPAGTITNWLWTFGSPNNASNEQNPSFTFPTNGDYQVTLTVTNAAGTSQPVTQTITVSGNVVAPTASFIPNTADGITYQFTDTSQPAGSITNWLWDFGGLGSSNEQNPSFTFPANGDYPITLTVTNSAGTSQPHTETIAVNGNVSAPTASFSPNSTDGITFQFTDTSQPAGTITNWSWDFGGAGSSNEQNPSFTFPANGDYPVTLTVTNSAGTSQPFTQNVTVNGNVAAPTASFTFESADGITFQFTDTSQPAGSILTWFWDFGRVGNSSEQNPVVTFPANGDFFVSLTVTTIAGTSEPYAETITVTGHSDTPPDDDSIADTTPVLPDISEFARIFQRYIDTSKDAAVFALAGDNSIRQDGFLKPFGDGQFTLDNEREGLRPTIDAYVGSSAFTRNSVAVNADFMVANLLNDSADGCNGENVFVCELAQSNSNIVVISIGLRDAQNGTDPEAFRSNFDELLQAAIDRGVAPVVMTIYPRPGSEDAIKAINEVIIETANSRQVPVINIWRAFNEIGSTALDGNNPSVGGGDADVLTGDTINTFGENTRNYLLLTVLSQIRQLVLGQS